MARQVIHIQGIRESESWYAIIRHNLTLIWIDMNKMQVIIIFEIEFGIFEREFGIFDRQIYQSYLLVLYTVRYFFWSMSLALQWIDNVTNFNYRILHLSIPKASLKFKIVKKCFLVKVCLTYEKFDFSAKRRHETNHDNSFNEYVMFDILNSNFGLLSNHWKSCQGGKVTGTFYG